MLTFLDTNVFLHAAGRPHPLKEACARVLRRVADGSLEATVNSALLGRHPGLSVRDAVHAATMLGSGITRIVSVDRAFDKIPGIHRLAPSAVG